MQYVYSPTIISGWDQLKPRDILTRIEGPHNCWLLVEVADGMWEHSSGARCGGNTCLLIPPEQRAHWRRRSTTHETLISFRGWREQVDEAGTGPDQGEWWQASGLCNDQASILIRNALRPIGSLWWKHTWQRHQNKCPPESLALQSADPFRRTNCHLLDTGRRDRPPGAGSRGISPWPPYQLANR